MINTLAPNDVTRSDIEAVLVFIESVKADEPTDEQVSERLELTRNEIRKQLEVPNGTDPGA